MKMALFQGCRIPVSLPSYGQATRDVLGHVGVELVDLDFTCCGYPIRELHHGAFVLSAGRNLALAERRGLDLVTPCKCCYGTLKTAHHLLTTDAALRDATNEALDDEGLHWSGASEVKHLLTVLADDVGVEALRSKVLAPLSGLRVAAHYGCHVLRPSDIVAIDNPLAPTVFETLVELTGATSVDWPRRLECCGEPVRERNPGLASVLRRGKREDAREAGADLLCTACTHCHLQLEGGEPPAVTYPALLARAMGLSGYDGPVFD